MGYPADRLAEIQTWLQRPITLDEALERALSFDNPPQLGKERKSSPPKPPPVLDGPHVRCVRKLTSSMTTGDELWLYSTDAESWENLAGEEGLAVVRDGKVVDFFMELMN